MFNRQRHAPPSAPDGTAAVELAVVLPVLLLIVLGCVDFGRVAYFSMAVENAVGAGSNYATTHRFTDYTAAAWEARVRDCVLSEMQGVPDFDIGSLKVNVETATGPDQDVRVIVTATYPFRCVVDWPGLPTEVLLRHRVSAWQYQ